MAFLDAFRKPKEEQAPPVVKPPAQEPQLTVEQMPDTARADAVAAASVIECATYHLNKKSEGGSVAALRQNQTGQEKVQEALSPTDGVKGKDATQGRGRSR